MSRSVIIAFILALLLLPHSLTAQKAASYKSFNNYSGMVSGVDFFASKKQLVEPYVKPVAETIERLKTLLGDNLPKGSIFICSTLEQKDSIYEPMILKMGYAWTLKVETPDIRMEEMMSRMRSMMGDDIPPEMLERFKSRQPSMMESATSRMAQETTRKIAYAVLQTSFAKNLKYRSSRLNDMAKSPLPDWLDIGIAVYVTQTDPNLAFLQQNMDQTFPIEDVLTMSRPFVASTFLQDESSGGSSGFGSRGGGSRSGMGGGQGFPSGGFGGMSSGGSPPAGFGGMNSGGSPPAGFGGGRQGGSSGQRSRPQRTIPKDEQDQMLFDGQSSTFLAFLIKKVGIEKVRELIRSVSEGVEGRDFIAQPDMLGDDYNKIEEEWVDWVKDLKPEPEFPRSGPPPAKQ